MDEQTFTDAARAQQPLIQTANSTDATLANMTIERWKTLIAQLVELKAIDKPLSPQECVVDLDSLK